ncbi:MAG: hypothetical protein RL344_1220 [Pseudomonadota bacterium]|jgi:hypothetical protein
MKIIKLLWTIKIIKTFKSIKNIKVLSIKLLLHHSIVTSFINGAPARHGQALVNQYIPVLCQQVRL